MQQILDFLILKISLLKSLILGAEISITKQNCFLLIFLFCPKLQILNKMLFYFLSDFLTIKYY